MKSKFTLIELLVVIAVIAILVALLFPALSLVKAKSQVVACTNNIKQLDVGVLLYHNDFNRLPNRHRGCFGWVGNNGDWNNISENYEDMSASGRQLNPYVGYDLPQKNLAETHAANAYVEIAKCPSEPYKNSGVIWSFSSLGTSYGENTRDAAHLSSQTLELCPSKRLSKVTELSQTVLMMELTMLGVAYDYSNVNRYEAPHYDVNGMRAITLFCDGSVRNPEIIRDRYAREDAYKLTYD